VDQELGEGDHLYPSQLLVYILTKGIKTYARLPKEPTRIYIL